MYDPGKRLAILTVKEIQAVYGLPQFSDEEREAYFTLEPQEKHAMELCRTYGAKVYFILQLGYFKTKQQFFVFEFQSVTEDVQYILTQYFPEITALSDPAISKPTRLAQQDAILKLLEYQFCSQEWKEKLQKTAEDAATICSKPVYIFKALLMFLEYHRVVIPGYSSMQLLVIKAITEERNRLEQAVIAKIPEDKRKQLDTLLTAEESLYQLTLLKREPKDFSYQEIQKEVSKRATLTALYDVAKKFLPDSHISNENIKYYASLVSYYSIKDLKRMSRETIHIYLLCFTLFRYQTVNDKLVETFLYHVTDVVKEAKDTAKEQIAAERLDANQHLKDAGKVLELFTDETIPDQTIFERVKERAFTILDKEQFPFVAAYLVKATIDETTYEWQHYVRLAHKFKRNIRPLFLTIPFASQTKDDPLLQAVAFLKETFTKNKSLKECSQKSIPTACIPEKWKKYLYETTTVEKYGKQKAKRILNRDKYEFFVYKLLKKGFDDGTIFVRDSNNFKSFEEDILSDEQWKQKDALIKSLNLPYLHEPIETILDKLETELEEAIQRVNKRITEGENPDIKVTGTGENTRWHLPYHNDEEPTDHLLYAHMPQVSIIDIIRFVHGKTNCLSAFTHLLDRYTKKSIDTELISACLIALGENIGLAEMAAISDISYQELVTTVHDLFRLETLRPANDFVTNGMAKLPIFKYYNIEEEIIHASIDGQKLDTQIETFNARHSPKYFVLGKGISTIALVANNIPINAKIIGAHEHESYFLHDLVFNNTSEVNPNKVSTDTHGTNHVNHAIADVFGYQFAPRYKKLDSQHRTIYGFRKPEYYKDLIVRPMHQAKRQLIIEEWDNMQRIFVSLSLKTTTQSTIVRKLSSYPRKNRTKKALWEFDNIIRSLYILTYIDSLPVRQGVQKALNRGEAYNRLRKAVFHLHQGKFRVKTELEQQIWSECTRFLTNCIIYYNAYLLSALLTQKEQEEKQAEADIIKRISPIAWRHVSLIGTFEFQKRQQLNLDEIVTKLAQEMIWKRLQTTDEPLQ